MQQPTPTTILTTYGPLGLSALVIIGLLVGWIVGRIDISTAMAIIGAILASWGVVGVGLKTSTAAMQSMMARQPVPGSRVTNAYTPSAIPMPRPVQEDTPHG